MQRFIHEQKAEQKADMEQHFLALSKSFRENGKDMEYASMIKTVEKNARDSADVLSAVNWTIPSKLSEIISQGEALLNRVVQSSRDVLDKVEDVAAELEPQNIENRLAA